MGLLRGDALRSIDMTDRALLALGHGVPGRYVPVDSGETGQ